MHLERLDLNLLIALDVLLTEKNVTRAAERMNISQPGMSAALQKLRVHFGDPLLERIGRRLEPTPRARAMAAPVKDILQNIKALASAPDEFDPATTHAVFRIAASTFCSDLLAVPLIRFLAREAPFISCQFDDLQGDSLVKLIDGQIDQAITVSQRFISNLPGSDQPLSQLPLFDDHMVLAVAIENRAVGDTISFEELCEQPYAETRFGDEIIGIGERFWQQQPRTPRVRAWLPNFQLTLDAVRRTDLIAMLPSRLAAQYADSIRTLSVPLAVPPLEEKIFWHPRNDGDPSHRWFRETLQRVANDAGLTDDQ